MSEIAILPERLRRRRERMINRLAVLARKQIEYERAVTEIEREVRDLEAQFELIKAVEGDWKAHENAVQDVEQNPQTEERNMTNASTDNTYRDE
ncbi:MAG: hypothetical protein JRG73_16430 [Deltaproteobacteria bacterium]|nr:hypothetical protein [Deltaproteobacteria bacterium]